MPYVKSNFTHLRLINNAVSFAWMIPLGMHILLILLNKANLPKSTNIDHDSLSCSFFVFLKVWRQRYAQFYESKAFFLIVRY